MSLRAGEAATHVVCHDCDDLERLVTQDESAVPNARAHSLKLRHKQDTDHNISTLEVWG